jgi:hypothetical protein
MQLRQFISDLVGFLKSISAEIEKPATYFLPDEFQWEHAMK